MQTIAKPDKSAIFKNKVKTWFSQPQNIILLLFGIVLTFSTVAPIIAIVKDTFAIHPGTIDQHLTKRVSGYTIVNYTDLFTSKLAKTNLWIPLLNTVILSVLTCFISILFGGLSIPLDRWMPAALPISGRMSEKSATKVWNSPCAA